MFDGSLVRRRSVGSVLETSPCIRVGKRKAIRGPQHRVVGSEDDVRESPNKVFLREQPSINTIAGDRFGDERMNHVQQGLMARQSLEENCLSAEGEDDGSRTCSSSSTFRCSSHAQFFYPQCAPHLSSLVLVGQGLAPSRPVPVATLRRSPLANILLSPVNLNPPSISLSSMPYSPA